MISNSDIFTRAVTVHTAYPTSRSEHDVGIGYGDDLFKACRVIRDAPHAVERGHVVRAHGG